MNRTGIYGAAGKIGVICLFLGAVFFSVSSIKEIAEGSMTRSPGTFICGCPIPTAEGYTSKDRNLPASKGAPSGKIAIVVDIPSRTMTVYSDGQVFATYPVSVGSDKTPSPAGDWIINDKHPSGGEYGPYWIGLNVPWGKYGIHGTDEPWSIGRAESKGCIRLYNHDIEEIYRWATNGIPVKIVRSQYGPFCHEKPERVESVPGDRGELVLEIQYQLRDHGFYKGPLNGIFTRETEEAVKAFQASKGLLSTGRVDESTYDKLSVFPFE